MSKPDPEHTDKEIQYRGGHLSEEDQEKIREDEKAHEDDVEHISYRGAEDDVQLHKKPEKHSEHIHYRGAEDDVDV